MGRSNGRRVVQQSKQKRYIVRNGGSHNPVVMNGTCATGKRRFGDEVSAQLALDRAGRNAVHNQARKESRYYPCSVCSGFHLTSQELNRGDRS